MSSVSIVCGLGRWHSPLPSLLPSLYPPLARGLSPRHPCSRRLSLPPAHACFALVTEIAGFSTLFYIWFWFIINRWGSIISTLSTLYFLSISLYFHFSFSLLEFTYLLFVFCQSAVLNPARFLLPSSVDSLAGSLAFLGLLARSLVAAAHYRVCSFSISTRCHLFIIYILFCSSPRPLPFVCHCHNVILFSYFVFS